MKKKVISILLAGAMAFSMFGCGKYEDSGSGSSDGSAASETAGTGSEAPESGSDEGSAAAESTGGQKVFRYSTTTEPTTFDQTKGNSIGDNEILHAIQEGLVRNTGGEVKEGIAESWEISDDGLTYTFHLRDALWSDGEPITAQEFEYGMQRLMDPETASPYAFIGEIIQNGAQVESGEMDPSELAVKATDDKTLEITLEYTAPYFLSMIGASGQFTPVRKDLVEQYGTDFAATADKNAYSGPFMLTSTDNRQYIFEKNPNFWDADSIHLDRVELSVVEDWSTALDMYEAGDLDYSQIPTERVPNYDDRDQDYLNGNNDYLYINHKSENKILGNKNFRLALNYGINRNSYNTLANNDVYIASNTLVMPLVGGVEKTYGEEYDMASYSYPLDGDTEKALEYLNKAMEEENIDSASDITVELVTTDNETNKRIVEVIQELWQSTLGINVTIRQVTYADIYGNTFPNHDYEIGYGGWGPDYSDPYTYLELFKSDNPYNYSQYESADFDQLLADARSEADSKTRMDKLNEAEKIIIDDGAFVPLQNRDVHYLIDDDVTGVVFYSCSVNIDWVYADITQ